jgi:hypothetical protein
MVETLCYNLEGRWFESRLAEDISGGKALPASKANNLTAMYEPIV